MLGGAHRVDYTFFGTQTFEDADSYTTIVQGGGAYQVNARHVAALTPGPPGSPGSGRLVVQAVCAKVS